MLSKNRIKFIHSLALKKNRTSTGLFVAEGPKLVGDLLGTFECEYIAASRSWLDSNARFVRDIKECDEADFGQSEKDIDYAKLYEYRYPLLRRAYKVSSRMASSSSTQ